MGQSVGLVNKVVESFPFSNLTIVSRNSILSRENLWSNFIVGWTVLITSRNSFSSLSVPCQMKKNIIDVSNIHRDMLAYLRVNVKRLKPPHIEACIWGGTLDPHAAPVNLHILLVVEHKVV